MSLELTEEEKALFLRMYAAFNERSLDLVLSHMHPEVEWPNGWEGGYVTGPGEIRSYWTRQWKEIDPDVSPVSFSKDDDGRFTIEVHQVVKDLEGNLLSDARINHIYRFQDGLIRKMEIR